MNCPSPWLGYPHGYLSDWITQRWVQITGRRIDLDHDVWLAGPHGRSTGIGKDFFQTLAAEEGLEVLAGSPEYGLVGDFGTLAGPGFDPSRVDRRVADFYEHTAGYDLDAWAHWCGLFRPLGILLALIFSRRLQQLNVPLSGLDTSRGVTSEVLRLADPATGEVAYTAWVRQLIGSGDVLYAGCYSVCRVPDYDGVCVKVVFPLPNGSAVVIMRPEVHADGSLTLTSTGGGFGEPGFYFVVRNPGGSTSARYVRALRESIHVYAAGDGVRADHVLRLWGVTFLRLHYRLRERAQNTRGAAA